MRFSSSLASLARLENFARILASLEKYEKLETLSYTCPSDICTLEKLCVGGLGAKPATILGHSHFELKIGIFTQYARKTNFPNPFFG